MLEPRSLTPFQFFFPFIPCLFSPLPEWSRWKQTWSWSASQLASPLWKTHFGQHFFPFYLCFPKYTKDWSLVSKSNYAPDFRGFEGWGHFLYGPPRTTASHPMLTRKKVQISYILSHPLDSVNYHIFAATVFTSLSADQWHKAIIFKTLHTIIVFLCIWQAPKTIYASFIFWLQSFKF